MKLIEQFKFYGRILKFKIAGTPARVIPKNTPYCDGCPYWDYNPMAHDQEYGYCHYIGCGDSKSRLWGLYWTKGTLLLWDGCKECNIE